MESKLYRELLFVSKSSSQTSVSKVNNQQQAKMVFAVNSQRMRQDEIETYEIWFCAAGVPTSWPIIIVDHLYSVYSTIIITGTPQPK